ADSVLVVDSDTVLPLSVPAQRLQPVPRRDPQRPERNRGVQLVQLALRYPPHLLRTRSSRRFGAAPVEDILRPLILEGPNHPAPTAVREREYNGYRYTYQCTVRQWPRRSPGASVPVCCT